jgi:hypothetical protein
VYLKPVGGGSQITLAAKCCSLVINKIKVNQRAEKTGMLLRTAEFRQNTIFVLETEKIYNGSDGKGIFWFVLKSGVIKIALETWVVIQYSERRAILNY